MRSTFIILPFCTLGPPILPELTALTPEMRRIDYRATLSCEAYHLNPQQKDSYRWAWKFKDSREIKANDDEKYNIFSSYSAPNLCQQTKGFSALQIANVSIHDFGKYRCELLESGVLLAVKDITFYAYEGMPFYVSVCCHF